MIILRLSDEPLPKYEKKRCYTGFETGFKAFVFFEHIGGYFASISPIISKIRRKCSFAYFDTAFKALAVLFLSFW